MLTENFQLTMLNNNAFNAEHSIASGAIPGVATQCHELYLVKLSRGRTP